MFDLFKKPVPVKCYNLEELAKILDWYRAQSLGRMAEVEFNVVAVTNGILSAYEHGPKILYFVVHIPYSDYKALREKFIQSESFDPILQQEPIAKILGRPLS